MNEVVHSTISCALAKKIPPLFNDLTPQTENAVAFAGKTVQWPASFRGSSSETPSDSHATSESTISVFSNVKKFSGSLIQYNWSSSHEI